MFGRNRRWLWPTLLALTLAAVICGGIAALGESPGLLDDMLVEVAGMFISFAVALGVVDRMLERHREHQWMSTGRHLRDAISQDANDGAKIARDYVAGTSSPSGEKAIAQVRMRIHGMRSLTPALLAYIEEEDSDQGPALINQLVDLERRFVEWESLTGARNPMARREARQSAERVAVALDGVSACAALISG